MLRNRRGFTLLEIIIAVAIVGILGTIATIHFIRAKEMANTNVCCTNLKQIQNAIQNWALDNNVELTDKPAIEDLVPQYIRTWPACPKKNTPYATTTVNEPPVCPIDPTNHHL